jgi:hypothetical protein
MHASVNLRLSSGAGTSIRGSPSKVTIAPHGRGRWPHEIALERELRHIKILA